MIPCDNPRPRLQALRRDLDDRLQRIRADRERRAGPLSADFAEQATELENDEVLGRLERSTAADLAQVARALHHEAQGHYGICERCGEVIEEPRLRVLPQATRCSHCASDSGH